MTPKQVLAVLVARWPWAVAVMVLCVAVSAAVSVTMLKRYTASATVMLDARTPDQVAGGIPNLLPTGYLNTQSTLISSERVGRMVIRALNLTTDPVFRQEWQEASNGAGDYEAWLSELLAKRLTVSTAGLSNVISVSYTADSAQFAAKAANAYVDAYAETSLQLRTERVRRFGGFFDARAQEMRGELMRAQAKLSEHQQKNGLLAVGDEKLDVESARLIELNSQLLAAQNANADISGRLRQAGRQADQLQEVTRSPAVAALSADVTREEVRLRELTARLGDSHPQLIEQEARLAELKARLAAEKGRAVSSVGFDTNAAYNRVAQLSAALEAQRAKVLRMQAQRETSAALQREVDSAQRAYDAMQQRVAVASIESQNTDTNVTVLKQASVPITPSSPNLLKNIGASVAVGLLLGLALIIGREQLDRRMRSSDDIAELKHPMLVALPVATHAHRDADDTSRTKLMKQRVLTGLPRPTQPESS